MRLWVSLAGRRYKRCGSVQVVYVVCKDEYGRYIEGMEGIPKTFVNNSAGKESENAKKLKKQVKCMRKRESENVVRGERTVGYRSPSAAREGLGDIYCKR